MASTFQKLTGFCTDCGSILPPLKPTGDLTCYTCSKTFPANCLIEDSEGSSNTVKYTVHFNSKTIKNKETPSEEADEGPVVERKCPKCGNEKMSYATLQLRSADEGQTVFYTCTNCKFKESENS